MNISYCDKSVQDAKTTKFLSFQIDNQINRESQSVELLKTVHFTYFPLADIIWFNISGEIQSTVTEDFS
jgi:hypothetical protein